MFNLYCIQKNRGSEYPTQETTFLNVFNLYEISHDALEQSLPFEAYNYQNNECEIPWLIL